jgi:hypothetical protein
MGNTIALFSLKCHSYKSDREVLYSFAMHLGGSRPMADKMHSET